MKISPEFSNLKETERELFGFSNSTIRDISTLEFRNHLIRMRSDINDNIWSQKIISIFVDLRNIAWNWQI